MTDAPWQPQKIARSRRMVDDFGRPVLRQAPARPAPYVKHTAPHAVPSAQPKTAPTKMQLPVKTSRLGSYVQIGLVVVGAMASGLLFQSLPLGEIAVAAYGIIALIRGIPSRTTFILALIALVVVPCTMLIGQSFLSENFAVYAFMLLIVAILSVWREVYPSKKAQKP